MSARLAPVALVPVASLAVHWLRYRLAAGPPAADELAAEAHGYLQELAPWAFLALGLGLGAFLTRLVDAWRGGCQVERRMPRLIALWATATAGLLAIYAGQELLEGWLAGGHPAGLAGAFGHGGLWALPAAAAVGLLLALGIRGARRAILLIARRRSRRRRFGAARAPFHRPGPALRLPAPLARAAAGRAPPAGGALPPVA